MTESFSRRSFLGLVASTIVACTSKPKRVAHSDQALAEIEEHIGGRLGVYALATDSGVTMSYRENELFALCSTFKWALVAHVLQKVDKNQLTLEQEIGYGTGDLLEYAPVTRMNVGRGRMTIRELAEAAVAISDNTAANLLLRCVDGPVALTRFFRSHGDSVTRLDRNEPMLNANTRGDTHDTTSPKAMVALMRAVLTTTVLSPGSRELLLGWMTASQTGVQRVRAGLPSTWRAGDKTGTGNHGAVNDVIIAWPPNRAPVLAAVYMSESWSFESTLLSAHRDIGRIIGVRLGTSPSGNG